MRIRDQTKSVIKSVIACIIGFIVPLCLTAAILADALKLFLSKEV